MESLWRDMGSTSGAIVVSLAASGEDGALGWKIARLYSLAFFYSCSFNFRLSSSSCTSLAILLPSSTIFFASTDSTVVILRVCFNILSSMKPTYR